MKSLSRHDGYLLIDHRFSPGVPADVARKSGFDPGLMGEGKFLESATITCAHCLGVVVKNAMRIRERAYCSKCDKYICDGCDSQRQSAEYKHICGEAISDAIQEAGATGVSTNKTIDLLTRTKIIVP